LYGNIDHTLIVKSSEFWNRWIRLSYGYFNRV